MKSFKTLLLFFSIATLSISCASLSGLQTGRTVGKGNGQLGLSLNTNKTPDFDTDEEDELYFLVPSVEFSGTYGITEKFDLSFKANTLFNVGLDAKVQVVGDQTSQFALSLGGGVGIFGFIAGTGALYNFQIPLYTSFHPSENFTFYVTPRYIGQVGTSFGESSDLLNYTGANMGVLFGKKVQFGLDLGIYDFSYNGGSNPLVQFGVGVKFNFFKK